MRNFCLLNISPRFRQSFRPSSGVQGCTYSIRYMSYRFVDCMLAGTCPLIIANKMHYFSAVFGKELYIFRTDLLSTIRSLNTVYTAIGICHITYVDCLLARSGVCPKHVELFTKINLRNSAYCWLLLQVYITMHGPLNVKCCDVSRVDSGKSSKCEPPSFVVLTEFFLLRIIPTLNSALIKIFIL
jgi:hypothetical protein